MSIRQMTTWVHHEERFVGYADLGGGLEDCDKIAKNALVIMAVGLKKRWKAPISFHFTAGLNAETQMVLIKQAISALEDIGIRVVCLVMDGLSTNQATLNLLGCDFNRNIFHFSSETGNKISCMLDQVHMIKVLRNLWAEVRIIVGSHGTAKWQHIEELIKLQVCNDVKLTCQNCCKFLVQTQIFGRNPQLSKKLFAGIPIIHRLIIIG